MKKIKPTQLPLFENADSDSSVERRISYNGIHVSQATFKAGLSALVHRWFRLTPSFGPDLVREMLTTLECQSDEVVLDPFAGAGTTPIECQLNGITSYGFEINPLLQFVGSTCLTWDIQPTLLRSTLNDIEQQFYEDNSVVSFDNLENYGLIIPPIHNPTRWWRPDVLKQLLVLKSNIDKLAPTPAIRDFFRLGLAAVLVPDLTNVTLGRLQLHFIDRSKHNIKVWDTFRSHIICMIEDIEELKSQNLTRSSEIFLTDSTNVSHLELKHKVNCVITSPPYPNRYSYVWNTRPHLYMLDFFDNAKSASDLDKSTIGGTWGTATSILSKGEVKPEYQVISDVVLPVVNQIRQEDNLMANYVMKYFNMLGKQISAMEPHLEGNARVAYVVGCSRIKEVFVETDVLLGHIFEGLNLGYKVTKIERIRKRNSGKDLHESIVYAWKN